MIKKHIYIIVASILLSCNFLYSQTTDVAFSINGKPIYKEELEKAYLKNKSLQDASDEQQSEKPDSFLNSYIQYRLRLDEAYAQKLDTTKAFQKELTPYRIQLQALYQTDTVAQKKLADKIMSRFENEIEVNHIFIPFDSAFMLPRDTIVYYKKIIEVRKLAEEQGFDKIKDSELINTFGVVVDAELQNGYLGWIRPLSVSQDIEDVLYGLKDGEITMPIRTRKGYHVFQVLGRRPIEGNPVVEQLLFGFSHIPATPHMQDSVYKVAMATYDEIALHDNFQLICDEFSRVFDTGDRGCLLGELSPGVQAPLTLIQGATTLENPGDVSEPILTAYGYHILRLKERKPLHTSLELKNLLIGALNSPKLLPELIATKREQMKEQTHAKINDAALGHLYRLAEDYNPSGQSFRENTSDRDQILLEIDGGAESYSVQDFLDYILLDSRMETAKEDQEAMPLVRTENMLTNSLSFDMLKDYFDSFVYVVLANYEKTTLYDKNPEYRQSIDEITEGILYTMLMEKEIWGPAQADQKGLRKIFEQNRNKYKFKEEVFKGIVIHSSKAEVIEEIEKAYGAGKGKSVAASALTKTYNNPVKLVQVEEGAWKKGENSYVDSKIYQTNTAKPLALFPYYTVVGKMIAAPEDYTDVRYEVEKDYQEQLEDSWNENLRKKYEVKINPAVLKN